MTINVKKLKKRAKIVKIAKIRDDKILQDIPLHLEITKTYFHTLEEITWLLRLKTTVNRQKVSRKIEKKIKF